LSSTSRSLPYSAGHVQLPNRVLLLRSPFAPRHQVPCSSSRVVPGAHRVVGPSTHRGSGPREVHTTTPDRQVFMAAGETPGPSGTRPDRYFEDISADELSTNAPTDETNDDKNARRERNRKRNERRRRLRESLPVRNLAEALDQVASRVHTTPEQCLMSISMIARQAHGIRAGEVISKLTEDAYFMRVDKRVTQAPPPQNS
jgi:hypothetical protein